MKFRFCGFPEKVRRESVINSIYMQSHLSFLRWRKLYGYQRVASKGKRWMSFVRNALSRKQATQCGSCIDEAIRQLQSACAY